MADFKDEQHFVLGQKANVNEDKANASSLWNEGEKNFLEDVTMNVLPDDENGIKGFKGRTTMKWDNVKKRYMLKQVDRDGKVIAEKKNEAGVKISKKMKEKEKVSIYKKWQEKTHLSLQKTGEMEDTKTIDQGRRAGEARRSLKDFKSRHG